MAKRDFTSPLDPVGIDVGNIRVLVTPITQTQVRIQTPPEGMNVRGVMVSCDDFFTIDDGQWGSWSEKTQRFNATVRRVGTYEDGTPAMRRTVMSTFRQAAEAFAEAHPRLLVKAALVAVNNDVHRVDNDIEKAEKVLNDLLDRRRALLAQERGIEALDVEPEVAPRM